MKILHRIWLLILVVLAISCKKGTEPTDELLTNLLENGSFEIGEIPTLPGWGGMWNHPDTSFYKYFSFSADVPPGGGQRSFKITNPDYVEFFFRSDSFKPNKEAQYKLAFWAKATDSATAWVSLFPDDVNRVVTDSVWKQYSIQTTVDSTQSLRVEANIFQSSGSVLFDLFRLEEVQ